MARGPRKTLEEKIEAKRSLIESLETRLESEKAELEEMLREKKLQELSAVSELIDESGLEPEEVAGILKVAESIKSRKNTECIKSTGNEKT